LAPVTTVSAESSEKNSDVYFTVNYSIKKEILAIVCNFVIQLSVFVNNIC
jgi:hypothetical protein